MTRARPLLDNLHLDIVSEGRAALDAETLAAAASRTASHGGFFVEISDRTVARMDDAGLPWMASGFFSSAR